MNYQNKTKKLLITLSLLAAFILIPAAMASAATITTDQEDYAPWEIVTLTGSGFAANSTVDMLITWPDGYPDLITGILTDADGGFVYEYEKEKFLGTYTVEATDGIDPATTTFTDSTLIVDSVIACDSTSTEKSSFLTSADVYAYVNVSVGGGGGPAPSKDVRIYVVASLPPNGDPLGTDASGGYEARTLSVGNSGPFLIWANPTTTGSYYVVVDENRNGVYNPGEKSYAFSITAPATDTVKPASSATSPTSSSTATFTVTYTASDSGTPTSGLASVELWAKKSTDASFANVGTDTIGGAPASKNGSFSFTAPGDGLYLFYTIAKDVAGNTEDIPSSEDDSTLVTIDASAPVVTVSVPTPDGLDDWFVTKPVTVTITADDSSNVTAILVNGVALGAGDVTGLGTTHAVGTLVISAEGTTNITATATDGLGNTGAGPGSDNIAAVNIDTVKPTLTKDLAGTAGTNGWFKSNVTVTLTGGDPIPGSGLDRVEYKIDDGDWTTYDVPFTISDEGVTTLHHRAYDKAGNVFELTAEEIKIDKTAPAVTITTPVQGAEYFLNQNVLASWSAVDPDPALALPPLGPGPASGIASATGTTANNGPIDTAVVGTKTYSVTAIDNAGNSTTVSVTYYVRFKFIGFLPPVKNLPDVNVGKAGRTYPIKWQLTDNNGNYISDLGVVVGGKLQYYQTGAQGVDPTEINYVDGLTTGGTVLRYDFTSQQFIYNWETTKSMAGAWYKLVLTLTDGSTHVALFNLTK